MALKKPSRFVVVFMVWQRLQPPAENKTDSTRSYPSIVSGCEARVLGLKRGGSKQAAGLHRRAVRVCDPLLRAPWCLATGEVNGAVLEISTLSGLRYILGFNRNSIRIM